MKAIKSALRPTRMALIVAAAGLLPLAANAQTPSMSEMQSRYKEDLQRCETLTDPERKQTCRREAGAALQEARRNRLATPEANTAANAAARCQRLPSAQRADCERLMTDSGAVEHGSVSGGGVLRELSITVPAQPGTTGTTAPATTYGTPATPGSAYGTQTAPSGTYGSQAAPSSTYGSQPVQGGGYRTPTPPASSTYGSQPAPAPGGYVTPTAPGSYGTQPAR